MSSGRSNGEVVHKETEDAVILLARVVVEHTWVSDGLFEAPFVGEFGNNGLMPIVPCLLSPIERFHKAMTHARRCLDPWNVDVYGHVHIGL